MLKRFALIAILALSAALAQLAAAAEKSGDEIIMELARKQLEDVRKEMESWGYKYEPLPPVVIPPIPPIHVYKERDWTKPGKPAGWDSMTIFNGYNHPILGPSRPSCMPYYEGCWGT